MPVVEVSSGNYKYQINNGAVLRRDIRTRDPFTPVTDLPPVVKREFRSMYGSSHTIAFNPIGRNGEMYATFTPKQQAPRPPAYAPHPHPHHHNPHQAHGGLSARPPHPGYVPPHGYGQPHAFAPHPHHHNPNPHGAGPSTRPTHPGYVTPHGYGRPPAQAPRPNPYSASLGDFIFPKKETKPIGYGDNTRIVIRLGSEYYGLFVREYEPNCYKPLDLEKYPKDMSKLLDCASRHNAQLRIPSTSQEQENLSRLYYQRQKEFVARYRQAKLSGQRKVR